jgi:sporulation protein YlmC with PRC-barrel domain
MRLSELLGCTVFDAAGDKVGGVNDVRLVQDGPYVEGFGAGLRVEGIVAGKGKVGERLGYHRGGVEGPWILKTVFSRLERRGQYISWDKVERIDDAVIHLNVAKAELSHFVEEA